MILKALYDYYHRDENLPAPGLEEKEIGFLLVLSIEGKFMYFEDCRIDKKTCENLSCEKTCGTVKWSYGKLSVRQQCLCLRVLR